MNLPDDKKFVPALPSDDDINTPTNSDTPNSIKIYDGVADCPMNDSDTIKNVKSRAKDLAQENLLNKLADYVNGFLRDRFLTFPDDEIFAIANEIYQITDVKYDVFNSDDNLMIRATVLAQIDDNNIMNCLVRFFNERIELKSQVEALRKENDDLNRQIAEFTPQTITKDKVALANQKFSEARELYVKDNYEGAIKLYDEAIQFNPYDYFLYEKRGYCYKALKQYEKAIQDYSKAIELMPDWSYTREMLYYKRGECYKALGDEVKANADFKKAKELN